MKPTYTLADSVIARICQILQEAILLGVDITDIMRQIEVEPNDKGEVVLTQRYLDLVSAQHDKLLQDAAKLQNAK